MYYEYNYDYYAKRKYLPKDRRTAIIKEMYFVFLDPEILSDEFIMSLG
jgi:hypothetical protein